MEGSNAKRWGEFRHQRKEEHSPVFHQSSEEVTQPRKLRGSPSETPSHQDLLRELLFSHRLGLVPGERPELTRVLEQRKLDQRREQDQNLKPASDLQAELQKRQQRMQEYEQEETKRRERQDQVPEFVRVRENLRRTQVSGQ